MPRSLPKTTLALVAIATAGSGAYGALLPWPDALAEEKNPTVTSLMRYRLGEARARGDKLEIRGTWTSSSSAPASPPRAPRAARTSA